MIEAWSVLVPPYARRGGTSTDQMEKRLMDGFHEKRGGA